MEQMYTATFLTSQWILNRCYRTAHCLIRKQNEPEWPCTYRLSRIRLPASLDAHSIHNGFAMGLGMAWTSGTTLAKMHAVFSRCVTMACPCTTLRPRYDSFLHAQRCSQAQWESRCNRTMARSLKDLIFLLGCVIISGPQRNRQTSRRYGPFSGLSTPQF